MRTIILSAIAVLVAGCGTPSLLITPVADARELQEVTVKSGFGWFPKKVAIVEVEGMLLNMRTGGLLQPSENSVSLFVQELDRAAQDPDVAAVVLRINSPGGTVTASDTMYQHLVKFRNVTRKPVVASTQDVCASGSYYVACGADKIIAHPTSVVGSVGVIFNTFNLEGTLDKLGIRADAIKSGRYKDMASPFRSTTAEERKIMQAMVDEYHSRFVSVLTTNRKITGDENLQIATDGRVFSGQRAVELGLADSTGTLEDAIKLARQLANIKGAAVIMYKRPHGYTGSIYATDSTPRPQANVLQLSIPGLREMLPTGFYYLWDPQ